MKKIQKKKVTDHDILIHDPEHIKKVVKHSGVK